MPQVRIDAVILRLPSRPAKTRDPPQIGGERGSPSLSTKIPEIGLAGKTETPAERDLGRTISIAKRLFAPFPSFSQTVGAVSGYPEGIQANSRRSSAANTAGQRRLSK
ncbi:MAG: hypothetical protein EA381_19460 [Planctomycetaceae bacterium]|nr:MAG: hypothetical protein EA381_19460 [Planctomycetaceae bacterium]